MSFKEFLCENTEEFDKAIGWIKQNARTKFVHMSKEPIAELKKAGNQSNRSYGKPEGLWGGRGVAWLEWLKTEMPHWRGEHVYTFEIKPEDSVDVPSICIFDPDVIKNWTDVSENVNEETQMDPAEPPPESDSPPYMEGDYECKKPPYGAEDEEADMLNAVNVRPPLMEDKMREIFRKRMGLL